MNEMIIFLKKIVKLKIIRPVDFYFSQFITKNNNIIMLIASFISYKTSKGHIFLKIEYFEKYYFCHGFSKTIKKQILKILNKKINWSDELLKDSSVSNGSIITPLVLYNKKIYLYKMWKAKNNILNFLKTRNQLYKINTNQFLDNLFINEELDNSQKIAIALTLINQITFISGGPGTGKTTTILKIIIALIKNSKKSLKIQLSAPTGKATTHLNNILKDKIFDLYLSKEEKKYLPYNATTIHQLLGIEKISQKIFFHEHNLLNLDVLIIDETSMIDILMMENIFCAVSNNTKLIFIGDHNQLSPIDSGSILKYICSYHQDGYNLNIIQNLKKITSCKIIDKINTKKTCFISNSICILKKNYRFHKKSGIYVLSNAICNKKIDIIKNLFKNKIENVFFYEINSVKKYEEMIKKICLNYNSFWKKINKKANIKEIIETFQNYQNLCLLNDGIFGINILNEKLEENMYKEKLIKYFYNDKELWYVGKPIIITHNNKYLNIYNGNIGITNIDKKGILQVSFLKEKKIIHNVPVNVLKKYKTAWTITVHKSQGSEFTNTALILPNFNSKVLNKDILYTGVTRTRNKLIIFGKKEIFIETILNNKNNLL